MTLRPSQPFPRHADSAERFMRLFIGGFVEEVHPCAWLCLQSPGNFNVADSSFHLLARATIADSLIEYSCDLHPTLHAGERKGAR